VLADAIDAARRMGLAADLARAEALATT
jgi:hypothetical protein